VLRPDIATRPCRGLPFFVRSMCYVAYVWLRNTYERNGVVARQRVIHPGIWSDPVFGSLSDAEQVLYIGLFSNADDEGRIMAGAAYLKSVIWPHRDVSQRGVERIRDKVVSAFEQIELYSVKGVEYIAIKNFAAYQKPKYPTPSRIPAPEAKNEEEDSPNPPETFRKPSPNPPEVFPGNAPTGLGLGFDLEEPPISPTSLRAAEDGESGDDEACGESEDHVLTGEVVLLESPAGRPRDPLWDAVADVCGIVETKMARGKRNRLVGELRDIHASAADVYTRAENLRRRWPDIPMTDSYLVRQWSVAAEAPRPAGTTAISDVFAAIENNVAIGRGSHDVLQVHP
jgi:hypothetical protein